MKSIKMSIVRSVLLLGSVVVGLAGCTPNPLEDLTVADSQVFITNHDKTVDFTQYETFSVPDSVQILYNDQRGQSADNFDLAFLSRIAQNMGNHGYTQVEREDKPDLGVSATYVQQTQTGVTVNPYFYDPYWGYGSGSFFYPSYYTYYQVSESYWYIQIVDLKNVDRNGGKVNIIWSAQIRGGGLGENPNRMIDAIFAQSDYLKKQ